jgi:hypothetical protein
MKRSVIEALWAKNPLLTIEQVRRLTGASKPVVQHVRAQLIAKGRLQPTRVMPDYLRTV